MLSTYYPVVLVLFLQKGHIIDSATWSTGTYALLKPKTDPCPTGWEKQGRMNQFTTGQGNNKSSGLHIKGEVTQDRVSRYFCIKTISRNTRYPSWPLGKYCMHGKLNRQHYGYIWMYSKFSTSYIKNVMPFVNQWYDNYYYKYVVEFYFRCYTIGNKKIPISLPITKPFYLLPYGSRDCQQVKWMVATSEWIKYNTDNYNGRYYKYGKVPYHELGELSNKGIKMYYCYYESCKYTLNDPKGVFQSPGFPGKYPDGQLCSWRIMVPDNHTLHVHFTNFSLYEYDKDCLQLYEYESRIFKPKQAYFGHQQPFTITATSDLMFVFRSDEKYNSSGFSANYTILKTPRCNYTLNDTKGVFQSPGFPGKYPDGQLCSWRIMVPDNHTLQVHFTNFSLYEYDKDCLQLYEYESRIIKPKQAYFGHQQPFTITATSDLMFVFQSDEKYNSNGFSANYTILKIPEKKTTTKPTTKLTTQPPPTTLPTTERLILTETPTTINDNSTTNETGQCNPIPTKDKSYNKHNIDALRKKTCLCDETWRIVVMVIPLAVFILIIVVIIDIFCRCRYRKALKNEANGSSSNDGMVINPTYERGNIIIDQPADATIDTSTVNTVDDQLQSRDDPPDYEDLDYTQVDEIPPSKRQECYALEPIGNDTSSVFYHVLEPSKTESERSQSHSHAAESVGHGASEVFYHTLESPTDLNRPTYQNLSELNHYTLNPVYEPTENSAPLVETNKLYDYSKA